MDDIYGCSCCVKGSQRHGSCVSTWMCILDGKGSLEERGIWCGIKLVQWTLHTISSGVSHSDGSCVLGRIHSDVSSNIPKKVYHIVTDNFVNLLHISYAWLYKTECWGRKFHAFSFNSHRNCKIFMTNFNFIFDTICVPYIFRKSVFGWNCDHDTPLCDTPLLEDTPLCDTPDDIYSKMQVAKHLFCDVYITILVSSSCVIDLNMKNIVLISNSRTAWPTKILVPLLSFTDNLLQDAHIIFQRYVYYFEMAHQTC